MNHPYFSQQELVSFVPLLSWIRAAVRCDFAIAPVLQEIGIPVLDSGTHGIVITRQQSFRLIEACVILARGTHFPFALGENSVVESIPEVQAYICSCVSLREALKHYDWVRELMSNGANLALHETAELTQIRLNIGSGQQRSDASMYFTETLITSIVRLVSQLLGRKDIEQLSFRHPAPAHAAQYAAFFGLPVQFGQPDDAVIVRTELLDCPLNGAVPELYRQAKGRLLQRLAALTASASIVAQLQRLFADDPALLASGIDAAAARLHITPRTLQRRLHDEGQTFSDVQSHARYLITCRLLRNTTRSVDDISEHLGFSDRRAFSRAFKRWSSLSPSTFRSANLAVQ